MIGERTAEEIKIQIGTAFRDTAEPERMDIRGRDLVSGLPKTQEISADEIVSALADPVASILEAIKITLEKLRPNWRLISWIKA